MPTEIPTRDGDGYLVEMDLWTLDIAKAMASEDGMELNDEMWEQIGKARLFYDDNGVVPPVRKFAKYLGCRQKGFVQPLEKWPDEAYHQIWWPAQASWLCLKN